MKLAVDLGACLKSGECYYNHPGLFEAGDDGHPVIRTPELTTERQREEARQAIEVCPAQVISREGA